MLLLDTHVWIWSAAGDERRLGQRTRRLLQRAEAQGTLCISPVTLFEFMALHTLGRLRVARTPEQWIRECLSASNVRIVDVSPDVALDAGAIPRTALADPLDRLLVATARQHDGALVTSDARILDYASARSAVRVLDAAR